MPESHAFPKQSLSFAKLVATPTDLAWSQVYNTGNVFVCLALTRDTEEQEALDSDVSLQAIGKETFDVLQAKFSDFEDQTSAAIKEVIATSLEKVPPEIAVSLTLAYFSDATLSVFVSGSGKVILKRKEKIGILLATEETEDDAGVSASGFVENGDMVILQTGNFAANIDDATVEGALDLQLPTDIVEALTPQVHERDDGAQAAIVIAYHGGITTPQTEPHAAAIEQEEEIADTDEQEDEQPFEESEEATLGSVVDHEQHTEDQPEAADSNPQSKSWKRFLPARLANIRTALPPMHMSHRRKLFLNIAIIILLLLGASIFFTMKQASDAQQKERFEATYTEAEQLYEEGQGLESLNPSLSQESYVSAEKLLLDGQKDVSKGSDEYKQLQELLAKVQRAKGTTAGGTSADVKEVTPEKNSLIAVAKETNARAFGEDDTSVYTISSNAITSVSKSSGTEKELIENDDTWSAPKAIVPYQANLYVLDQKAGVLKFVAGADGYNDTKYFTGTAPNLSNATGMAIDGSVWILLSDGSIKKYTSGKSESFTISGLDTPMKNPKALVTDLEMGNLYILDAGNSRIVQLSKSGAFEAAYKAPQLNTASTFTVADDEKSVQILSGDKVWELTF